MNNIFLIALIILQSCISSHSNYSKGRCTVSELLSFQAQPFMQVDSIEDEWLVLVNLDDDEYFIRRACLERSVEEGTVFRFGLVDSLGKRKLKEQTCLLLQRISGHGPTWCSSN